MIIFELHMKKILTILLLFVYLICASGVRINVHYCGGKLKQISFFQVNEKKGCCGNKMKSKNCCKDKVAVLKIKDVHKAVSHLKAPGPSSEFAALIIPVLTLNFSTGITLVNEVVNNPEPPDLSRPDIYLSNGVLLI